MQLICRYWSRLRWLSTFERSSDAADER